MDALRRCGTPKAAAITGSWAMPGANVLATAQAVQALSGMTLGGYLRPGRLSFGAALPGERAGGRSAPLLPTSGGSVMG